MTMKKAKKKNIRMRRRVRKTIGVVCLITALLVAAVPVPKASAAGVDKKYIWDEQIAGTGTSRIPTVAKDYQQIYTHYDENGNTFIFAFMNDGAGMTAVILRFNPAGNIGDPFKVPDRVRAYTLFRENVGDDSAYVAVSRSHKPLYYMVSEEKREEDVSGNVTITPAVFAPCYYVERQKWENTDIEDFYYKDDAGNYQRAGENASNQWIRDIPVRYIGDRKSTRLNSSHP